MNGLTLGGLKHVSDTLFNFFCSLEVIFLSVHGEISANEKKGIKDVVIEKMIEDEDVLFCWSMVAINWEEDKLMKLMIEHWVRFSYVSSFVEKYKKRNKQLCKRQKV